MRLTAEAVKTACVTVADKLIKFRRSVYIVKLLKISVLVQTCNNIKIFTAVKHIFQLVFQLVRLFPNTAVKVHKI